MIYLSKGGRITLIKSTLSNFPMYFLSLFHLSRQVANKIEKIFHANFWNDVRDENKFYLISWDEVCIPIPKGGLGI